MSKQYNGHKNQDCQGSPLYRSVKIAFVTLSLKEWILRSIHYMLFTVLSNVRSLLKGEWHNYIIVFIFIFPSLKKLFENLLMILFFRSSWKKFNWKKTKNHSKICEMEIQLRFKIEFKNKKYIYINDKIFIK